MRRFGLVAVTLCAAVMPCLPARAQSTAPILTDRPTQSAATFVVSPKVLQIEAGYRFTHTDYDGDPKTDVHRFPDALLRLGVVGGVEARLTVSGMDITGVAAADGVDRSTGFNDVSLGAKFAVADEKGVRPAFSILVDVTLPAGSEQLTCGCASPKLLALLSSTLSERWTLTANIGPAAVRDDDSTVVDLEYAGAIGAMISARYALFAEFYGALAFSDGRRHQHSFQTGATALLNDDLQLDARVGFGLVDGVPDWLTGLGLSWRLFS